MSNEAWPSSPFEAWRDIYANLMAAPAQLELSVRINRKLSELAHRETANRFWGARGKCSPMHFFWRNSDLAVTRFPAPWRAASGRLPDWVLRDASSHECSSCGFWPGGEERPQPLCFPYAYPAALIAA